MGQLAPKKAGNSKKRAARSGSHSSSSSLGERRILTVGLLVRVGVASRVVLGVGVANVLSMASALLAHLGRVVARWRRL